MSVLEHSDRAMDWRQAAVEAGSKGQEWLELRDKRLAHGYWLRASLPSVHWRDCVMESMSLLQCEFEGGHWIGVSVRACELAGVRFRHMYFENVDFRTSFFSGVHFEHCVFNGCLFPDPEQGGGGHRQGCHWVGPSGGETAAADLGPVCPDAPKLPTQPVENKDVKDRFEGLEREGR